MGRSKSTPVRRRDVSSNTTNRSPQVLGRTVALQNSSNGVLTSVDQLLALQVEQERREEELAAANSSTSSSSNRPRSSSSHHQPKNNNKRVRFDKQDDEESNNNNYNNKGAAPKSRLETMVARIEREEAEKQQQKKKKRKQKKSNTKKKSSKNKTVSFADDSKLVSVIHHKPEIRIIQQHDYHGDRDGDHSATTTILWYYHHSSLTGSDTVVANDGDTTTTTTSDEQLRCLGVYALPPSLQIGMDDDDDKDDTQKMPSTTLRISSQQGAMEVWKLLAAATPAFSSSRDSSSLATITCAVGRAVKERTVILELLVGASSRNQLRVSLTLRAMRVCHSSVVPLQQRSSSQRRTGQKKYQSFNDLQSILTATVLGITTVPANKNVDGGGGGGVVTAKQVYALTDNVQLQASLTSSQNDNNNNKLVIPGLLPTLRPYQERAVEWMLQREQQQDGTISDDEWELAWVVVCEVNNHHLGVELSSSSSTTSVSSFERTIPLPQWRQNHAASDEHTTNPLLLLYCPFTGWLAESIQQARSMTTTTTTTTATTNSTKGGILAESMGLGKSVEVLACILAHPKPSTVPSASSSEATTLTKRQLVFDDDDTDSTTPSSLTQSQTEPTTPSPIRKVGVVGDMDDFGDADDDDTDEGCDDGDQVMKSPNSEPESETPQQQSSNAAVVTPSKDDDDSVVAKKEPVGEMWTDEEVLGACICGDLIGFSTTTKKNNKGNVVIVCASCHEPMHMGCAAFRSEDEMKRETKALRFMQTFSNQPLDCRLCDKNKCPCCVEKQESGATLIITPPAILSQWEREIQRHARTPEGKPLRVVVYEGIKRLSQSSTSTNRNAEFMHPSRLAEADIVLMTFDALLSDLGHSDDNRYIASDSAGNLRKRKRYRVVPSPLVQIKFWRVCLDEAQRVEVPTAGSAKMALKLETHHRWCVTGTPVGRGKLEDLFGLLLFLRIDPFCDKVWFRKCLSTAYENIDERIKHLLKNVFWRSTKSFDLVRQQMGVPEQIEKKVMLQFSSIEKHFYDRQLEQTLSAAGNVAESNSNIRRNNASQLHMLAEQLHRLRAACCHPQVGTSGVASVKKSRSSSKSDSSVSSRVMTMTQILDKFIDDAKIQCEEAQRLAVLHTNGMAALSRLKVEAKERGVSISEDDKTLLEQSCKLYLQSLQLADENATPTLVQGEATLSGSVGFHSPRIEQSCDMTMEWKWHGISTMHEEVYSNCDFTIGPARKITQITVRAVKSVPKDLIDDASDRMIWHVLHPKDVVLQCSAIGGEFVDVHEFSMPHPREKPSDWIVETGFRSNKSKNWRLVVKSFHSSNQADGKIVDDDFESQCSSYLGLDVQLFEACIANDPLQRLHCLHNASVSFSSLLQAGGDNDVEDPYTKEEMLERIDTMTAEARKIESLYLDAARAIHNSLHRRFEASSLVRKNQEQELFGLAQALKKVPADCWEDAWWDDFLVLCHLHGSEAQQRALCDRLLAELEGVVQTGIDRMDRTIVPLPAFRDINGLRTVLQMRVDTIRSGLGKNPSQRKELGVAAELTEERWNQIREGRFKCSPGEHAKCMKSILDLSPNPTEGEMMENSRCSVCKEDWFQTGPKCRHCKIGEVLEDLTPDTVTIRVLRCLYSAMKAGGGSSLFKSAKSTAKLDHRAETFFEVLEAEKKEKVLGWRLWRTHLDLLNDIDELNQCKTAMRLTFEGEDVTELSRDQLNAVVVPVDVSTRYHDHAAKQAMALGSLSRAKGTLQYLKNQSAAEQHSDNKETETQQEGKEETCIVCLSTFDTNRAVLRCGHSFHLTPCLKKLQSRSGGSLICCPLRCRVRTEADDVMIASEKRHDDGSRSKRRIKGSFGTKVTRLVSDILDVCDSGEKSIVFSMWEDMLDICEQALKENDVRFVRVASLRRVGECTKQFRSPDCSVMLLNVKNGAEGLTLLEATHVFMVEPLLNCGLDSQAINRVHRIGQNRKTYVWRYLVQDTIECKIDKLRMEHQEDQLEDSISDGKKSAIQAGGIDGGFASQQELLDILTN